jgi:hypothetical protein
MHWSDSMAAMAIIPRYHEPQQLLQCTLSPLMILFYVILDRCVLGRSTV